MCSNFSTARRKVSPMRRLRVVLAFSDPKNSSRRNRAHSCRLVVCPLASRPPSSRVTVSQFHVEPVFVGHGSCCPRRYRSTIGLYEEWNAGNAIKALMDSLAPKVRVRCSGTWREIDSSDLVPGDMISFKIGDIVPADSRLTEAINISIDQAKPCEFSFLAFA